MISYCANQICRLGLYCRITMTYSSLELPSDQQIIDGLNEEWIAYADEVGDESVCNLTLQILQDTVVGMMDGAFGTFTTSYVIPDDCDPSSIKMNELDFGSRYYITVSFRRFNSQIASTPAVKMSSRRRISAIINSVTNSNKQQEEEQQK